MDGVHGGDVVFTDLPFIVFIKRKCVKKYINIESYVVFNLKFQEFVPGPWTKVVRLAHIELTNADAIFAAWLSGLLALIPNWSLSERKRALALATSQKVCSHQ